MGRAMTEKIWLRSHKVRPLLNEVRHIISVRKIRLFGCACCRRIWHLLNDGRFRRLVEISELYAEGQCSADALRDATADAKSASVWDISSVDHRVWNLVRSAVEKTGTGASAEPAARALEIALHDKFAERVQADLFRDIAGNPFGRPDLDPRWLSSTVIDLARSIHRDRAYERLPILADALMDAGCDSDEIINHCRGEGPHVLGCWVVDLLLEKK